MAGSSDREKAAERQLNAQRGFSGDLRAGKYNITNPFSNYTNQFSYNDIANNLNNAFSSQGDLITKSTADATANAGQNAVSSLASRGVTGGSAIDTVQSNAVSDLNKQKDVALTQLGINRANTLAKLQELFNNQNIKTTSLGANIGLANNRNVLAGLGNSARLQSSLLQSLSDDTWLDDALGIIKTLGGTAAALGGIPGLPKAVGLHPTKTKG